MIGHRAFIIPLGQVDQRGNGFNIKVVDPSGAVIPNARVSINNRSGALAAEGETDVNSVFRPSGVPKGSYVLQVAAQGFRTSTQELTLSQTNEDEPSLVVGLQVGRSGGYPVVSEQAQPAGWPRL